MIKYIGSKRTLVPKVVDIVTAIPNVRTVCDLFTGTTRVAQGLKRRGYYVVANDSATYAEVLAQAYVEADRDQFDRESLLEKLAHLSELPGHHGYFTETFCVRSRYFQPHNGMRVDAIRPEIDKIAENELERAILLVSLMEAADRVDSTTGLQMAYLKKWAPRSYNDLELRLPKLLRGSGKAARADANLYVREMSPVDVCYIDPPYNQHSYFSNYHIWETLIRWDQPETYGIACKRVDCRINKSDYNSKRRAWSVFEDMIRGVRADHLVVSFNNEGYFASEEISELLDEVKGSSAFIPVDFKRYVGAQIGIHDLQGRKVGKVSHLRNKEHLFVAGPHALQVVDSVLKAESDGEQLTLEAFA